MTAAAAAMSALCVWRLYHLCIVHVKPNCVAVVYSTRRRRMWHTSIDAEMTSARRDGSRRSRRALPDNREEKDELGDTGSYESSTCEDTTLDGRQPVVNANSSSCARVLVGRGGWLGRLWRASMCAVMGNSAGTVVKPPSSLFRVFVLPRAVFTRSGSVVSCAVAQVEVADGWVSMWLTVRYRIPFAQLERYLAANGPHAPHEAMAECVAEVVRTHAAHVSVGNLISHSRRQAVFMPDFTSHLYTRLMSETVVCILEVRVENVELADTS